MTTPPLISAPELAALLDPRTRAVLAPAGSDEAHLAPAVFDASYLLEKPEYDGDHRSQPAFAAWRAQHIPGSRYVDVQEQFSLRADATHFAHPDARTVASELARLGVSRSRRVVVYDTTGTAFAARLWYLLTWIGVDARVLDGGLDSWRVAGLPTSSGDATEPVGVADWTPASARDAWIPKEELLARPATDARPLVCSLSPTAFDGVAATRYARRGHIPGSVNVPASQLFDQYGRMKPPAQLWEAFTGVVPAGEVPDAAAHASAPEVLLYCGGGISASAAALALARLGVRAVRIYDGSLEEWSADESLPLEVAPRSAREDETRPGRRRRPSARGTARPGGAG